MAKKKRVVRNVNWFVDAHYKLKMKRDVLLDKVNDVKADITKIEAEALHKFGKEGIEGAKGRIATCYVEERDHVRVSDRRALDAYVKRTGHMELFQNRVSAEAYRELLAQRKKPAGVEIYTSVNFRTRKR